MLSGQGGNAFLHILNTIYFSGEKLIYNVHCAKHPLVLIKNRDNIGKGSPSPSAGCIRVGLGPRTFPYQKVESPHSPRWALQSPLCYQTPPLFPSSSCVQCLFSHLINIVISSLKPMIPFRFSPRFLLPLLPHFLIYCSSIIPRLVGVSPALPEKALA